MQPNWNILQALESARSCSAVIKQMTADEIVRALQIEEGSQRRKSVLTLLYRQSRVLARITHQANLKEKIHGS